MLKYLCNNLFQQKSKANTLENSLSLAKKGLWIDVLSVLDIEPKIDRDGFEKTIWHYAIESQQIAVIRKLIANKIGILFCDKNNESPLHYAVKYGQDPASQRKIVKLLLQAQPESARIPNISGHTPLYLAVKHSDPDVEIIRFLGEYCQLASNIDIDQDNCDELGNTPLHLALSNCHFEVAEQLIRVGANIDFKNDDGLTPRDIITQKKHTRMLVNSSFFSAIDQSGKRNSRVSHIKLGQ